MRQNGGLNGGAESHERTEVMPAADEEQYRKLLEDMPAYVCTFLPGGALTYVNQALAALAGMSAEELLGRSFFEMLSPEDLTVVKEALEALTPQQPRETHEETLLFPDGSTRSQQWTNRAFFDSSGRAVQFQAIGIDITERKKMEQALLDSEKLLKASQKVAGLGSYVLDIQTGAWSSSDVLDEVLGIDEQFPHTVEGWAKLLHPEWRERMRDYLSNQVIGKKCRFDKEYKIVRHNDGQERWVHGIGELEFNAETQPVRMIGTIWDITERKQAEARLMQVQKMESIGRLAGGVAHDFNNLLTVINGYSHLLLDKLRQDDPLRASIEEIHRAGERAAGLTQQLLAFSRKQVLRPRVLDLNHVVGEMLSMLGRLVGENVDVRLRLNAKNGMVHADPHQLERVVMNLVVNARDAMPHGGKLSIETAGVSWDEAYAQSHPEAPVGHYVTLSVSDSGAGMDEETKKHIFEPFFTTKDIGKGTGLGLSTVQGIVAQSGGYIEVYSEPGHGTSFRIYLPMMDESVANTGMPASPVLGGQETVLVVEDQAEVREYAATVLKSYGYRVITAESGAGALLQCEREDSHIDLILTDLVMPNMSGRELADRLEKLQCGVKVLFMSGYTDSVMVHHGVLEEHARFLQKPFSPEQLAIKVREALGGESEEDPYRR